MRRPIIATLLALFLTALLDSAQVEEPALPPAPAEAPPPAINRPMNISIKEAGDPSRPSTPARSPDPPATKE